MYSSLSNISVVSTDRMSWTNSATRVESEIGAEILENPIAQLGLKANLHLTEDTIGIMNVIKLEEIGGMISGAILRLTLQVKAETTVGVMEEFADKVCCTCIPGTLDKGKGFDHVFIAFQNTMQYGPTIESTIRCVTGAF
jgi:hypothetical protein